MLSEAKHLKPGKKKILHPAIRQMRISRGIQNDTFDVNRGGSFLF